MNDYFQIEFQKHKHTHTHTHVLSKSLTHICSLLSSFCLGKVLYVNIIR